MDWIDWKEILTGVISALVGFILGVTWRKLREWWALTNARARYQYLKEHDRDRGAVEILDSAIPEFIVDQNSLIDAGIGQYFFLHPSRNHDFKAYNRRLGEQHKGQHFHLLDDVTFGRKGDLSYLAELTGIADLPARIEAARETESVLFLEKAKGRSFNSQKVGVRKINFDRRGDEEQSRLDLVVYITDFFTHQVMQRVVSELMREKIINVDVISRDIQLLNERYYPFMTSLGLNVFLFTDFNKKLVLTRRSANIAQQSAAHRMHVTMNEGFSAIDFDRRRSGVGGITVENCYRRGMREELGFPEYETRLSNLRVYDLFLAKDIFQVGLFAWASYDGFSSELLSMRGQDKKLEIGDMQVFDFTPEVMNDLLEQDIFTSYAGTGLRNLCQVKGLQTREFNLRGRRYYRALTRVLWNSFKRSVFNR